MFFRGFSGPSIHLSCAVHTEPFDKFRANGPCSALIFSVYFQHSFKAIADG